MKSNNKKNLLIFIVLTMSTGVIYKLPYIQDVFYVPLQESLNLPLNILDLALYQSYL